MEGKVCLMGDIETDRAIIMGNPIRMVMKCKPHNGEEEADEQG